MVLFDEITAVLNAYADDVSDVVKVGVDEIAKQTVAEIQANARAVKMTEAICHGE